MNVRESVDIDGIRPRTTAAPTTATEVADVLSQAAAEGLAVAPVGGGGALALGNLIERYDVALDMRGLDRILEHQASDLVLSVEAGARLDIVSEMLARHGQWLPIEAPNPSRATIGGLIATALSGPGRLGHGSLRDYLIGISVVTPTGGMAKAGGMVVKNVSGFDLMRLHHGALGTLGVIVSANFKVLPAPRGQATVVSRCDGVAASLASLEAVERKVARPSAGIVRHGSGTTELAVRFDGLPGQVKTSAQAAGTFLGLDSIVLVEEESRAWWRAATNALAWSDGDLIELRLGTRPAAVAEVAATATAGGNHDISLKSIEIWPQLGTIIIRASAASGMAEIDSLIDAAEAAGATWRITSAPPELKRGQDVWGRSPASLATMRRLKEEFDPGRVLNPGRFSGHI